MSRLDRGAMVDVTDEGRTMAFMAASDRVVRHCIDSKTEITSVRYSDEGGIAWSIVSCADGHEFKAKYKYD